MLTLTLSDGSQATGDFEALTADSLHLAGGQAFALRGVSQVERPWRRVNTTGVFFVAGALDLASITLVLYALSTIQLVSW